MLLSPRSRSLVILLCLAGSAVSAQERIDTVANRRIRAEAFEHSQVLATAIGLSDLQPPRLAGSPGYLSAARYARDRLRQWQIPSAQLEPWGRNSAGWVLDRFSLEMVSPWYLHLTGFPKAWSPSTPRPVTGSVTVVRIKADSDLARYAGKLRGKIVLNGAIVPVTRNAAQLDRWSDAELDSLSRLTERGDPANVAADLDPWLASMAWRRRYAEWLKREGVLAAIDPSQVETSLRVDGLDDYPGTPINGVPHFVITRDHFNRVLRLVEAGQPVRLSVSLRAHTVRPDSLGYNVIAEMPGTDLKDQVVMLGGHLDSWISGTGAADNAAGCAVVMEALRILQAQGLHPRRTIRIALWDGEEPSEIYAGSTGYVIRHLGDPRSGKRLPAHQRFSTYLNFDNGSGRVRGVWLQGNSAARPIFEQLLAPWADLGANHVTLAATGETDHISFESVGLPGFQFIQDRLDYESRVHHSNLDVADYLVEEDLEQAAAVLASVALHLANRDDLMPRP